MLHSVVMDSARRDGMVCIPSLQLRQSTIVHRQQLLLALCSLLSGGAAIMVGLRAVGRRRDVRQTDTLIAHMVPL